MARNEAQDEFVDLYEVLELPENADTEQIRKRVNQLYIEAQQNLDHRNVKKRLQFQQMYEIYLPQARHLLLDSRRRGEYDRYLQAYRTGSKVAPAEEVKTAPVAGSVGEMGGAPGKVSDHDLPEIIEQEVDPEQLAVEREAMWAKWKTGLELISEEPAVEPLPGTTSSASQHTFAPDQGASAHAGRPRPPAPQSANRATPPQPVAPRFDPNRARSGARPAPRPGSVAAEQAAQAEAAAVNEVERQREQQRFQLIKNAVQTAGMIWGAAIGAVVFVIGCAILFTLDNSLKAPPFGLSRTLFGLIGFVIVLLATALGAYIGRNKGKRKAVTELSVLSLEELMRRSR